MADTARLARKAAVEASQAAVVVEGTAAAVEVAKGTGAVVEAAVVATEVVEMVATVAEATTGNSRIFRFFFPQEGPVVN